MAYKSENLYTLRFRELKKKPKPRSETASGVQWGEVRGWRTGGAKGLVRGHHSEYRYCPACDDVRYHDRRGCASAHRHG